MAIDPKRIYEHLNQTRHRLNQPMAGQLSLFDAPVAAPEWNDAEYWMLSDLVAIFRESLHIQLTAPLDDQVRPRIDYFPVTGLGLNKGFDEIAKERIFYSKHAVQIQNNYNLGDHILRTNMPDMRLSRYACWSLVKTSHADTFAETYFLTPAGGFQDMVQNNHVIARVKKRAELSQTEKDIVSILRRLNIDYKTFYKMAHNALFYNYPVGELKLRNSIAPRTNDSLSNYMGEYTLAARNSGLCRTILDFSASPNMNSQTFFHIAENNIRNARNEMIRVHQLRPENNLTPINIARNISAYNNVTKWFRDSYASQTINH